MMKILVLELARLGDIYQTWPALRALKRLHPDAEVHVLTRPRFSAAMEGLTAIDRIHQLPTGQILEPLVQVNMDVKQSYERISSFVDTLKVHNFDWIVNFSFSPFSSLLTHALAGPQTRVSGYTRTNDGYLSIPDDISAYFYAQGGVGRPNRFHLIEIFATMVGADLLPEDFRAPELPKFSGPLPKHFIALHIGASQRSKALSVVTWAEIVKSLWSMYQIPIVLIGAPGEKPMADELKARFARHQFMDYVGETSIPELFQILLKAQILVGCDSAPIHMATMTQTPCLNISLASVNFWETGPRAPSSFVFRVPSEKDINPESVAVAIKRMIVGEKQDLGVVPVQEGTPSYWALSSPAAEFDWQFAKAIYLGEDFPFTDDHIFIDGMNKLCEVNQLMMENLEKVSEGVEIKNLAPILERGEELIETIAKLSPSLQVLVRWYQTEKVRIGPQSFDKILQKTIEIHLLMKKITDLYQQSDWFQDKGEIKQEQK